MLNCHAKRMKQKKNTRRNETKKRPRTFDSKKMANKNRVRYILLDITINTRIFILY